MPLSVGLVLVFMLGFWSGMVYLRASRLDRSDRLCKTIASLRAELAQERLKTLSDWLREEPEV